MKGIILAAGRGTRVKPLTYEIPKPMLPIINQPVMELLVRHLARHGVSEVVVNTSYRAPDIENYFRDGSRFGLHMAYSFEGQLKEDELIDEPLGSAGALKRIQEHSGFFNETFVVVCGDAIIDIDLQALLDFHHQKKSIATIALAAVPLEDVSSYGIVVLDQQSRVLSFQEKPLPHESKSNTANTGIYIFEPEVLEHIPSGSVYDIGGQLFPQLVAQNAPIYGAEIPFQWLDIGQVTDYYQVILKALRGEINGWQMPGIEIAERIWTGCNVRLDLETCTVVPPVYIGGSATLEPGCTVIGPSYIGPGCRIASEAHVEQSVVFDYTRVGSNVNITQKLLCGKYCVDADGTTLDLRALDVDWAISDARSQDKPLDDLRKELITALKEMKPR